VVEKMIMPKLAMVMQEGQILEWLVEEGDWVEKGQEVMNIETEKVVHTCEAPSSGYIHILSSIGQTVPVFDTVALLATTEGELVQLQGEEQGQMVQEEASLLRPSEPSLDESVATKKRVSISPVAKKLAIQNNLDYTILEGTGSGGRITRQDVEAALALGVQIAESEKSIPTTKADESMDRRVKSVVPLIGVRQRISDRMLQSLAVSAQMSIMGEVDADALVGYRKDLLEKQKELDVRITYTDLFVSAIAKAVKEVPIVNASLIDGEIRIWENVNVGVAVAAGDGKSEGGLVVPVVKHADKKSIQEISVEVKDLTSRAREGKLVLEDVQDGTITLSNVGMLFNGWTVSTPIINQPETMIIQPGVICDRPMVREGQLVVGKGMSLSITFDHRVMDGVPAADFMNTLIELIENPERLLQD
jgi:pyruvate/2-oxoglutarate dehydrogenase complex dihydrolipoamide acyltransferase (E2) component